jgi:hypothetical protein
MLLAYSTMSGPDARSPRYRHHGQSCGSQGRWRAPGNRSGGRAPTISAAVFAGFQSDRTGLQQSEIKAAQGRRAHSQRTLSQNRPDFPLLQNSRMYKFLQARGVRVNVGGICSSDDNVDVFVGQEFRCSMCLFDAGRIQRNIRSALKTAFMVPVCLPMAQEKKLMHQNHFAVSPSSKVLGNRCRK